MAIANDFEEFINNIAPNQLDEMNISVKEIAKKLNNHYYDLDADETSHIYIVGSVGRETSIKGVSDIDIIFDLPKEKYTQYDNYGENSNGQSSLLQEVKNVLLEKYPKTDISGDGQVVVIAFKKYTVELVPGFKQSDNSFKYPDTHDGGSWKITNPLPEIKESKKIATESNNVFIHICNMIREWKNNIGFEFGGLLIDTLAYNFLNSNGAYKSATFDNYLDIIKDVFYI